MHKKLLLACIILITAHSLKAQYPDSFDTKYYPHDLFAPLLYPTGETITKHFITFTRKSIG